MAKFYPLGIQAVVDNSSPVAPVLWYFLGEYMDKFELYYDFDAIDSFFIINAKSMWSLDENSPYYFKKSNLAIRVLLDKEHLSKQALKNNKTIYIAYQGIDDKSDANPDKKREFYELLKHFGFDANLLLFSKKDIDGKFIKNTEHGLGLSNKLMLKRELPLLLEKLQDYKPSTEDKSISYVCDNELFSFKDMKTKLKLEIKKLKT